MISNIAAVQSMQKKLEGGLVQEMADFENRLKAASNPTNLTLCQLHDEFYAFKEMVSSKFNLIQQQIHECVKSIDAINMHHRKKALVFTEISESPKKNLQQEVLLLLHNKMGLTDINNSSLRQCFRLGIQHNNRPRPVVVFFCDYQSKSQVWNMKSKLKGSSVSMGEFLTKIRQSIYKSARNHFGLRLWSFDGTIYIKHPEGRAKIYSQEELDTLITEFPQTTSVDSQYKTPDSCDIIKPSQTPSSNDSMKTTQPKCVPSLNSALSKVRRQQPSLKSQEDDIRKSKRLASKK